MMRWTETLPPPQPFTEADAEQAERELGPGATFRQIEARAIELHREPCALCADMVRKRTMFATQYGLICAKCQRDRNDYLDRKPRWSDDT